MKVLLLSALLLTAGIAMLPQPSAECELGPIPPECEWTPHGIRCEG